MNAFTPAPVPPFPPNPTVGQVFQQWVWNGSAWVCQGWGPMVFVNVYLVSGTYWPRPGLNFLTVECMGGGGGGGGAQAAFTTAATWVGGGGGGGAGAYSRIMLAAALVRGGVPITIGVGGVGGAGASALSPALDGTTTQFGLFCIAPGGGGAWWNNTTIPDDQNLWGQGGSRNAEGIIGVGDILSYGSAGSNGLSSYWDPAIAGGTIWGGAGGGSFYGGDGQQVIVTGVAGSIAAVNGGDGQQGSGGDGGVAKNGTANGGNGGPGLCIVTEWCFGNTSIVEPCNPCGGPAFTEAPPGWQAPAPQLGWQQGQKGVWTPQWGQG
jgi:hypothetical protein